MATAAKKRIGLLGYGMIGSAIAKGAIEDGYADVAFVHGRDPAKAKAAVPSAKFIADIKAVADQDVDLVVEAANDVVVRATMLDILKKRDMMIFTMTCLADEALNQAVRETCKKYGTRLYIPHGGLLGLDGIYDGRSVLEEVTITTTKAPKSLGLDDPNLRGTIYDGPTRKACEQFPRNVNIHACLAICGIGFDRQRSVIVSDPDTKKMSHVVEVKGKGLEWRIEVAAIAGTGVTGAYTPISGRNTVKRVLASDYDIVLA
jgi:aspartate dehydrogenase